MKEGLAEVLVACDRASKGEVLRRLIDFGDLNVSPGQQSVHEDAYTLERNLDDAIGRLKLADDVGYTELLRGYNVEQRTFAGGDFDQVLSDVHRSIDGPLERVNRLKDRIDENDRNMEALKQELAKLSRYSDIDFDLSYLRSQGRFEIRLFYYDGSADLAALFVGSILANKRTSQGTLWLLVWNGNGVDRSSLGERLAGAGIQPLPLDISLNPHRRIEEINLLIDRLSAENRSNLAELQAIARSTGQAFLAAREGARFVREVTSYNDEVGRFYVLRGEVPESRKKELVKRLGGLAFIGFGQEGKTTLLSNPRYVRDFEPITDSQGRPGLHEVDPTPIISAVFPVFFGIMFPDLGQGLVLLLFGYFIYLKGRGGKRKWGTMLMSFGAASSVVGLIIGEVFGFSTYQVPVLGPLFRTVDLFNITSLSYASIDLLLTVTIFIGIFHMMLAWGLDVYQMVRMGRMKEAMTQRLPVLTLYAAAIMIGLSIVGGGYSFNILSSAHAAVIGVPNYELSLVSIPLAIISLAVLNISQLLSRLRKVSDIILDEVILIIEFMANTISYTRLGVLMMVHIILMSILDSTAALGLISVPILVFGNIGIMLLEGLIVYIQSLRLHVYEWFTKFYKGDGTGFKPFVPQTLRASISMKGHDGTGTAAEGQGGA